MEAYVFPAISATVALLALIVAFVGMLRNSKNDTTADAASHAEVITKLDFIINDTKELKAEIRSNREEVSRLRTRVEHAVDMAEAAHRRMDRAGIDKAEHE